MPGKLKVTGDTKVPNDPMIVKAYCEGRQSAKDGNLSSVNPHPIGTVNWQSWATGHSSWTEDPAGVGRDACDLPYGGGFVAP